MSLPRHQFSVAVSQTQNSLERRDKKIEVKIKTLVFEFLSSLRKVTMLLKVLNSIYFLEFAMQCPKCVRAQGVVPGLLLSANITQQSADRTKVHCYDDICSKCFVN